MRTPQWPQDPAPQRAELLRVIAHAMKDEQIVAMVRLVAVQQVDQRWFPVFARIDICRESDLPLGPQYQYVRVRSVAVRMGREDFLRTFADVIEGRSGITADEISIAPLVAGAFSAETYPSHNDYTPWPCLWLQHRMHSNFSYNHGPLVSARAGVPYLENVEELVAEVAGFRVYHRGLDARSSSVHVFVWDYTGRLAAATVTGGNQLVVEVQGEELQGLQVVGRIVGIDGEQQIRESAAARIEVTANIDPDKLELALVGPEDQLIDQFRASWTQASEPANTEQPRRSLEELFLEQIRLGERDRVEFKPYVRFRDDAEKKWEEIFETCIGMANGRGGFIFLGISNRGVATFDSNDYKIVCKEVGRDGSAPIARDQRKAELENIILAYGELLRDRIQQYVNKSLPLALNLFWIESVPVLALIVRVSEDKPHMDVRDNSIWYRTNATTRRPSETELATLFANLRAADASEEDDDDDYA